ncbi:MAG: DUF502 domain-containing protein [Gemmatimonadales bacterium]
MSARESRADRGKYRVVRRLRRFFLVGLIVIAPVGLTAFVLTWVFRTIDPILGVPLRTALGFQVPGLGILLLALVVMVVGWLVHLAAGKQMLHWWNHSLARFPLTGRVYSAISQIVQSVVGRKRKLFLRTVLIPYPTEGIWAVAFVTNESAPQLSDVIGEPCVNVFVPTTPNPTSGFMLMVPRKRTLAVNTSVEDAMKLVVSAGAVNPAGSPAATVRTGLDVDLLLKDTGEWKDTQS